MPVVSIISAIYNAESTLQRCVDSILAQTFRDFELLLIDDGSTDRSAEICDEYALADHRIKVVHKKNEGVASTRQCGMDLARGEYMMHVDPDDWIEQETLEKMLKSITNEKALIAICDYSLISSDKSEIIRQEPTQRTSDSMMDDILSGRLLGGVCNKLISKHLWGGEIHLRNKLL